MGYDMMNPKLLKIEALADFVDECVKGLRSGDLAGVAILYSEMAETALDAGISIPFEGNLRYGARENMPTEQIERYADEMAVWADGLRQGARAILFTPHPALT